MIIIINFMSIKFRNFQFNTREQKDCAKFKCVKFNTIFQNKTRILIWTVHTY